MDKMTFLAVSPNLMAAKFSRYMVVSTVSYLVINRNCVVDDLIEHHGNADCSFVVLRL